MIEFKLVSKRFGPKLILNNVSFLIGKGEIVFIIGKSGVGKSVSLKCIVGLLKPEFGEVWVDGQQVNNLSEKDLFEVRRKCGMVFQNPALLDSLTVFENLAFGVRALKLCKTETQIKDRVVEKMGLVGLNSDLLDRFPPEISFGMQKRISLARTLAVEPSYLLFDEPTTGQDPVSTNRINRLILRLSLQRNVTARVVSHDMHCAMDIANRIIVLDRGEILEEGSPESLMNSPHALVQDFMKEATDHGWGGR